MRMHNPSHPGETLREPAGWRAETTGYWTASNKLSNTNKNKPRRFRVRA